MTDAGTPGISDPGAVLVRLAVEAGIEITPVPGPAAAITLLSVSGLDTHAFVFEGFLPIKSGRKRRVLESLAREKRTLIFYESPHRLVKTLALMLEVLGDRPAAVGRELTKVFEEITRGTLAAALESYRDRTVKGELTIAVAGFAGDVPPEPDEPDDDPDSATRRKSTGRGRPPRTPLPGQTPSRKTCSSRAGCGVLTLRTSIGSLRPPLETSPPRHPSSSMRHEQVDHLPISGGPGGRPVTRRRREPPPRRTPPRP